MAKIESGAFQAAKDNKMKIVNLSKAEVAAFKKASASVYDDYIKKQVAKVALERS